MEFTLHVMDLRSWQHETCFRHRQSFTESIKGGLKIFGKNSASVLNTCKLLVIISQTTQYTNYLHWMHIASSVVSNVKFTGSSYRFYANPVPLYTAALPIWGFSIHGRSWNLFPGVPSVAVLACLIDFWVWSAEIRKEGVCVWEVERSGECREPTHGRVGGQKRDPWGLCYTLAITHFKAVGFYNVLWFNYERNI